MDEKVSVDGQHSVDLISELPDGILNKILSYLPTKNAVATSILSTRWKNIFPFDLSKIEIDLDDSLFLHPQPDKSRNDSFINFVDKLLNKTLCDVPCVESFSLNYVSDDDDDDKKFLSWICTIVRLSVQNLKLCSMISLENLFLMLDGCTSLTRLELSAHSEWVYIYSIEDNFSLPNLRTLSLRTICLEGECALIDLLKACPALEEFYLSHCYLRDSAALCIKSHVLKILSIEKSFDSGYYLTIDTPNLESLFLKDDVTDDYSIHHFNSLESANIDVRPSVDRLEAYENEEQHWYCEAVRDLVNGCRNTRYLYLGLCPIESLYYANKQQFPEFQNLTSLSLASVRSEGWVVLACLLNNSPKLELLTFEEEFEQGDMGFADFERLVPSPPTCLELHIKSVEFTHFGMKEDEIKLLNYFVQNGKVLEKVVRNAVVLPIKR